MGIVKDIIYVITILLAVFFHFRDKATRQAVLETKIETMLENQRNILDKFKENDKKWDNQTELNGKVLMYIDIDSHK
jgi:hypothetical protein